MTKTTRTSNGARVRVSTCLLVLTSFFVGCGTTSSHGAADEGQGDAARASGWTPAMQFDVRRVAQPRLSPSGQLVVFEVATADFGEDRWGSYLHLARCRAPYGDVPLCCFEGCRDARWGPSDEELFVRTPDAQGCERVHRLDLRTGALAPLTPQGQSIGWFEPSPDAGWIAFTTLEEEPGGQGRWRIHVVPTRGGGAETWDLPGSVAEFSWSPQGDRIAATFIPGEGVDWRTKALVLLEPGNDGFQLVDSGPGLAWLPCFCPTGQRLAFVASPGSATWMRDLELRVLDLESLTLTTAASTPDRNIELLAWQPNGEELLGLEYAGSTRRLVSVPIDGGLARYLGPEQRSIVDAHVRGGQVAFRSERWNEPPEIYVADLSSMEFRQVSFVQPAMNAPLGETSRVQWTSTDGAQVEGLLTYPVGYQEGARVPLLVRLHGGPPFPASDGYLGGTSFTAYPLASMASEGFAVLQPNFRGSTGYGVEFRHGLHGDWGGQDYRDVMAGVDALIARGLADPDRLGIMGWSYGGFLTAWTITQDSRFAAASLGAAMTDLGAWSESTTLGGMFADWFGGSTEERAQWARERSPISQVSGVACPILVQHGVGDRRVPMGPVTEFAAAVLRAQLEVEFRPYEGGHGPRTPRAELAVLEQNLDWFLRNVRDLD